MRWPRPFGLVGPVSRELRLTIRAANGFKDLSTPQGRKAHDACARVPCPAHRPDRSEQNEIGRANTGRRGLDTPPPRANSSEPGSAPYQAVSIRQANKFRFGGRFWSGADRRDRGVCPLWCCGRPLTDRGPKPPLPASTPRSAPDRPTAPACTFDHRGTSVRKVGARGDRLCAMAKDLLSRSAARASMVFAHLRGPLISHDRRAGHVQVMFYTLMAPARERDTQNWPSVNTANIRAAPRGRLAAPIGHSKRGENAIDTIRRGRRSRLDPTSTLSCCLRCARERSPPGRGPRGRRWRRPGRGRRPRSAGRTPGRAGPGPTR